MKMRKDHLDASTKYLVNFQGKMSMPNVPFYKNYNQFTTEMLEEHTEVE